MNLKKKILAAALVLAPTLAAAQATLTPYPSQAVAGSMISVKINGWQWPTYAPATRYVRQGNTFIIDFEYASDFFGPSRPDFWDIPVPLGELPAGTYNVQARMIDTANPNAAPQVISSPLTVATDAQHLQSVPSKPHASENFDIYVPSSYYFDPASVKLTYDGNIVRVDYRFDPRQPVTPMLAGMSGPPGLVSWTRVTVSGLPPGDYWMYSVGSPNDPSFTNYYIAYEPLQVRTSVEAIEYYAEATDRYFVTSTASEITTLDQQSSGWKRTGQQFEVWPQAAGAPAGAQPVCRFYAPSLGAHYHTAIGAECAWLRDLETQERATISKSGDAFKGWAYEGVTFYAVLPSNGQCADGWKPVNRGSDGPHRRYASDMQVYGSMAFAWKQEGAVFCTPR
ncbi:hypothetical protein [Usitatibacter palustris]|uniref:DUF5648 domain-containing protein n=1 Tax=Usitatibacter palustris TaxID=2732487 RepID=A0A6M4H4L7_9PROT|nr:hypothetical protein [Usitatibacter palustris]QJR13454.1 hypothetical protein DSM104440_00238 [Usitatibacter palustris]